MADQYAFGAYRLDVRSATLTRDGQNVALPAKAAELLIALVRSAGDVLGRDGLVRQLWPDAIVEDGTLTSQISLLRKTLGKGSDGQHFIETLPKRGYRFRAPVERTNADVREPGADNLLLLVLPFENFSEGERYDYFSEGLTEEMITELARLSPGRLRVIARTSAMHFKATTKTIGQVGAQLGATHILEGSVRRSGDRVRITAQLIRVSDESHLWAQNFDRELHNVLEVQTEVAAAVAREICVTLTPDAQRRLDDDKRRSIHPEAYESYLRGRHLSYRRTEQAIRQSIQSFEEALAHDSTFASAYVGLSDAHTMLACRGICPAVESFHKAKTAARQAVQLQPRLGEAYASLAHVRLHDWDWVGLDDVFQQAMQLDPGYAIAHYWYAEYLIAMGNIGAAQERAEHARTLDPLNPVINVAVGMIHYLAHDYDRSLHALRRGLELEPTHYVLHLRVGLGCLQLGLFDEAMQAMQQAVGFSGGSTEALTALAQAHAAVGQRSAMENTLRGLIAGTGRYVSPYNIARVYAAIDDDSRALEWLEKAYQEHNPDLIELTREPTFSRLHEHERFRHLVRRVGWPLGH